MQQKNHLPPPAKGAREGALPAQPAKANIIMDTTYFGRDFGVMVLMGSINGQALFVGEVKHESNALYSAALNAL